MKLAILDKDNTITAPASGNAFVQSPADQSLLPGVDEAVARLVADGYTLVVASNQGGCDVQTVPVSLMKPGQYWLDAPIGGVWKVKRVAGCGDRLAVYGENEESLGGVWNVSISSDEIVKVSWKLIGDAVEEMRYCMKLLPAIETAFFCPDFAGSKLYMVLGDGDSSEVTGYYKRRAPFRKPEPGMLQAAMDWACVNNAVMIGDRAEDEGAAQAAGILFLDTAEWRHGIFKPA